MRTLISRRSFLVLSAGGAGLAIVAAAERSRGTAATAATPVAGTATPAAGAIEHPTGGDEVVLRVENVGGFLPPQARLTELPLVSLYGDGRLVTQGPQIAIFPPPALPNLRQLYLTEEGIQEVLAAADEAGLIGRSRRYENPIVADAPYTLVTVNAGGATTRVAAYALGLAENPEWTPEQREELAELERFLGAMMDVAAWLPASAIASGDEEYPIERLQVTAEPYDPARADPTVDQPPMDWPLATPISAFAHPADLPGLPEALVCAVVSGTEADALVTAARDANALTPWVSEGERYLVSFRPLLPDETGCPPRTVDLEDLLPEPEATPAA